MPFIIIGIIYWIYDKLNLKLNKILMRIHIIISILGTLLIILLPKFFYYRMKTYLGNENLILELIGYCIIIAQLIFLINLIIGIFKKKDKPIAHNV